MTALNTRNLSTSCHPQESGPQDEADSLEDRDEAQKDARSLLAHDTPEACCISRTLGCKNK